MSKRVEIKDIIITDSVGIYTFQFENSSNTEFEDFVLKYQNVQDRLVKDDFNRIIKAIDKISNNNGGAVERFFRTN